MGSMSDWIRAQAGRTVVSAPNAAPAPANANAGAGTGLAPPARTDMNHFLRTQAGKPDTRIFR